MTVFPKKNIKSTQCSLFKMITQYNKFVSIKVTLNIAESVMLSLIIDLLKLQIAAWPAA